MTTPATRGRYVLEFWRAKDGWRWRVWHRNRNIIAESGEAYTRLSSARRAWRRVRIAVAEVVE